jgi:hypothetical protein
MILQVPSVPSGTNPVMGDFHHPIQYQFTVTVKLPPSGIRNPETRNTETITFTYDAYTQNTGSILLTAVIMR